MDWTKEYIENEFNKTIQLAQKIKSKNQLTDSQFDLINEIATIIKNDSKFSTELENLAYLEGMNLILNILSLDVKEK